MRLQVEDLAYSYGKKDAVDRCHCRWNEENLWA